MSSWDSRDRGTLIHAHETGLTPRPGRDPPGWHRSSAEHLVATGLCSKSWLEEEKMNVILHPCVQCVMLLDVSFQFCGGVEHSPVGEPTRHLPCSMPSISCSFCYHSVVHQSSCMLAALRHSNPVWSILSLALSILPQAWNKTETVSVMKQWSIGSIKCYNCNSALAAEALIPLTVEHGGARIYQTMHSNTTTVLRAPSHSEIQIARNSKPQWNTNSLELQATAKYK